MRFTYDSLPSRVVFRTGALDDLAVETARLGSRALVVSTPGQRRLAERCADLLGAKCAGIYDKARMHTPGASVREACAEVARVQADCCVAIGGGSTIGLAKGIAFHLRLPILAVPTTYSGSEATSIWGYTENGIKHVAKDAHVQPRIVIYDPLLTLDLRSGISGPSGVNAIAHCVEALYAENANPLVSLMAEEGIRALGRSLPAVVNEPRNVEARSEALYGSWLGGVVLGAVGMALHHKLCHVLGGAFDLPHAETHTILLPHATAYNAAAAPEAMRRIARALGAENAAQGLFDLNLAIGAWVALKDIGMPRDGIERAVELATKNPYYNPAPIRAEGIRELLVNAWEGNRP
ncbi:MAG TPA: maleylacetate reductase [Steroidobacteraceae bacterium]|nr:maleylacetate reductase [Steroidobacteraceae bacterium]